MDLRMYLWLAGMWLVGSFVYSMFGLQITITKRCALKLQDLLKSDPKNWYPDACEKYWKGVIRKNRIIMFAIGAAVFFLVPGIGVIGYFVGIALKWLTTLSAAGPNENNLLDCEPIFSRYAKPGCEQGFTADFFNAAAMLINNKHL